MADDSDFLRIPEPHEFAASLPPIVKPRRRRLPVVVGTCCGLAGFVLGAIWGGSGNATSQQAVAPPARVLNSAVAICGLAGASGVEIGDGGSTLTFNGKGKEDTFGASLTALSCLLDTLDAPDAVRSHINQTTSLDGRQETTWVMQGQSVTFAWTFHPDRGLDGVLEEYPEVAG